MCFFGKGVVTLDLMEIRRHDIYKKYSRELILFDGRTFRVIGTHPEELLVPILNSGENRFWGIFRKICGYRQEPNSSVSENFGDEIWSCSIQKINKNSSRRTPRRNFGHQIGKIQEKKSKMMKIRILINSDVEVVAHSEVVQNTFKTLKLSIFDHISSLK